MRRRLSCPFVLGLIFHILIFGGSAAAQSPSTDFGVAGQWSPLITFPYRPVHAMLLPSGKVLFFSYYSESYYPQLWDPATNITTAAQPADYQLFCSGHVLLPDGTIFIAGGHLADYVGTNTASIYDPAKDAWTRLPEMNAGRWYPTTTLLANGDVLVTGGSIDPSQDHDPLPQIWQHSTGSWRDLTGAQLVLPLYPKMFLAPNGKAFYAGPERVSRYLDTNGTGTWTRVAGTNLPTWRDYGSAAMYDVGKVIIIGGNQPPGATSEIIDLNSSSPLWQWTGSMNFPRRHHTATILPDGSVLVTGGSAGGASWDDESKPVKAAELWNAATGKFSVLASESNYRGYHAVALLLPDGRVFSGGSNKGGPNGQIFSPPYLFKGSRPTIADAPDSFEYGSNFTVNTPDANDIAKVSLIALGSVTHTFDFSQRYLPLRFTGRKRRLAITSPANANIAPPGFYMLFLVSKTGVPSIAKIVALGTTPSTSGPPPPPSADTPGAVSGIVTKISNGMPLASTSVNIGSQNAVTSSDGRYSFPVVPAGTYTMNFKANGYLPRSSSVQVTPGATLTEDMQLATGGQIAGGVTFGDGTPVVSATVEISGGVIATELTLKTNSTGNFFQRLDPGRKLHGDCSHDQRFRTAISNGQFRSNDDKESCFLR